MSNINLPNIGEQISIIPLEVIMRDEEPKTIRNIDQNIIVNLNPTEGTLCVLVLSKNCLGGIYYFDRQCRKKLPLFSQKYTNIGSEEIIQQDSETY